MCAIQVLYKAQMEFRDYHHTGVSVLGESNVELKLLNEKVILKYVTKYYRNVAQIKGI
jgi:hypothetical protein